MTIDQLRYFTAAATHQHVGRAATASSISASAISHAVACLQEELQCELFRKKGRRIELTTDGKKLLARSKAILSTIDGLKKEMKGEAEALIGRYRFGASHFLTSRLLLKGWQHLHERHPDLVADLYSMNTAFAIGEVLSGRLDLSLCFSPVAHPDLKEVQVHEGELLAVVRKGHPILKKPPKEQIRFLAETKAAIHKSSQGIESCETHPVFEALGFQPKVDFYFDSDDTAVNAVLSSNLWTFLPDIVVESYKGQLQSIPLPKSAGLAPYHISAVIHRERAQETVLQKLCESLLAQA